jgi:hypothetical protein
MTAIPGSIRVTGFIAPSDDTDVYATHEDVYGKGGFRPVANVTTRNLISSDRRKEGMWVMTMDDGKVYKLSGGILDMHWVEVVFSGGTSGELIITTLAATAVDLVDDTDFTVLDAEVYISSGVGYIIEITPTTATGNLTVILYQDVARLEPIFTMVLDLTDTTTYRSSEVFGFDLETLGTIYGTAFTSGVPVSQTFDISISATPVQSAESPTPLPSPYGDGIEDDGTGKPRVALASTGGLQFSTGKLVVKPDTTAAIYPTLSASGIAITGAVDTTTTQSVSAKKLFSAVGSIPTVASGAPITGTYAEGHIVCDSNNVYWACVSAGTPGTWELFSSVYETPTDIVSTSLTVGTSELVEIPVIGNVGTIQRLQIWGVVASLAEYSLPFRARIYENSNEIGRELIWQGNGLVRQTYLTAIFAAGTSTLTVNDNNIADTDETIVLFEDANRYELTRIDTRPTGQFTIDEPMVDANAWAVNTYVLVASEWTNVPFVNTETSPSSQQKIYLQIRHDGVTGDPAITFYVRATTHSVGVIR